ncbi:MAG: SGNH/GDSL hydrolase family protein [Lachnospiraceae bacterium]|nr:SGNH/GDSL hydrolase family protein [Lachnospiraceae bacterium]
MNWFNTYSSNTLAGSGNQSCFLTGDDVVHKGRVYYKIFAGGRYRYSLLFSNILDSTYADGEKSCCNMICDEWQLIKATVGVCKECDAHTATTPEEIQVLTFQGKENKDVMPGEFFVSDSIEISAEKNEYLCVEITFRGTMIPSHEQSILPAFVWDGEHWEPSCNLPFPGMIGCDRSVHGKIGFMGDSITQGIGTPNNAYSHWCALVAESMGDQYAYWNLGLGFGRAQDAASDGAWLFKAKHMDWVVLGYGTNDIGKQRDEEAIKKDLLSIVLKLKGAGTKVLLQTLPPFSWKDENLKKWININHYIRNTLSAYVDAVFDIAPLLTDDPQEQGKAKYGGHPNEAGCRIWAEALIPVLRNCLKESEGK